MGGNGEEVGTLVGVTETEGEREDAARGERRVKNRSRREKGRRVPI
jgi:predicted GIY-YIG superfamily endonuclease